MTTTEPNVSPSGRYELKEAAAALGVDRSTLLRYSRTGLIRFTIKRSNKRKCWSGADLISFWRANY